jgi:hypothetical protein
MIAEPANRCVERVPQPHLHLPRRTCYAIQLPLCLRNAMDLDLS